MNRKWHETTQRVIWKKKTEQHKHHISKYNPSAQSYPSGICTLELNEKIRKDQHLMWIQLCGTAVAYANAMKMYAHCSIYAFYLATVSLKN